MTLVFHDPPNGAHPHEYLTKIFFKGLRQWLSNNGGFFIKESNDIGSIRHATVLTSADYLNVNSISSLKNNGCKIVGFSITDSSYISQSCRVAAEMSKIDLIFAATGLQKINEGHEFTVDPYFNIIPEKRKFLPEDDWIVYNNMRKMGRLQSLPYVHWSRLPEQPVRPYSTRSQKVVMRGGLHARRFVLALFLMQQGLLDVNSGFITFPYFAEDMNPRFKYCEECRNIFRTFKRYPYYTTDQRPSGCTSPAGWAQENWDTELGKWNNCCPRSFYWLSDFWQKKYGMVERATIEKLVNATWLSSEAHQELLGRITFTSDLKWLFSIYAAQRFWDAAAAGCVNVLPSRTMDQEYFPAMRHGEHYAVYGEDMQSLAGEFILHTESSYDEITKAARALYDQWIVPGPHVLNTNLCHHIIQKIEEHAS